MKAIFYILVTFISLFGLFSFQGFVKAADECDGVKLNTKVPFIDNGSGCIKRDKAGESFPELMGGLTKIVITAIMITSFILIIVGGVMYASGGFYKAGVEKGKSMIKKVIIGLILLGLSGVILHLINPSFFK